MLSHTGTTNSASVFNPKSYSALFTIT